MGTDYDGHKGAARRLLAEASRTTSDAAYQNCVAGAQVHATLALAAATARLAGLDRDQEAKW